MKLVRFKSVPTGLGLGLTMAVALCSTASAQTFFTQPFTGTSLPGTPPADGFTTATDLRAGPVDFSAAGADFTGIGDDGRNYIRTTDTAYNTVSFTASINLTIQNSSVNTTDGAFFGMGVGALGTFNEPGGGGANPSVYLRLNGSSGAQLFSDGPFGTTYFTFAAPAYGDNLLLSYTYDSTADNIVFSINDLTTSTLQTSTPIALGSGTLAFTSSTTSVFFGGSQNSASGGDPLFSNLQVQAVPEPATWSFVAVGFGMLLLVSRKRTAKTGV